MCVCVCVSVVRLCCEREAPRSWTMDVGEVANASSVVSRPSSVDAPSAEEKPRVTVSGVAHDAAPRLAESRRCERGVGVEARGLDGARHRGGGGAAAGAAEDRPAQPSQAGTRGKASPSRPGPRPTRPTQRVSCPVRNGGRGEARRGTPHTQRRHCRDWSRRLAAPWGFSRTTSACPAACLAHSFCLIHSPVAESSPTDLCAPSSSSSSSLPSSCL